MLFNRVPISFTPATIMVIHTNFALVLVFPVTALTSFKSVISSASSFIFLRPVRFSVRPILSCTCWWFFISISKLNYFFCNINSICLKPIIQALPVLIPRLYVRDDSVVILTSDLSRGVTEVGQITRKTLYFKNISLFPIIPIS